MSEKSERHDIDWTALYTEWRLGILSNRQLGAKYGCTEAAIRKKAKDHGWTRDLSEAVRKRVRNKLIEIRKGEVANEDANGCESEGEGGKRSKVEPILVRVDPRRAAILEPEAEDALIEDAAEIRVAIVRDHSDRAARLKKLADRYIELIEMFLDPRSDDETERKRAMARALLFPAAGDSLGGSIRTAAQATEKAQKLERESYDIDGDPRRLEVSGLNGEPIAVKSEGRTQLDLSKFSDEQLAALVTLAESASAS